MNIPRPLQKVNDFLKRKQSRQLTSVTQVTQRSCGSLEKTCLQGNVWLNSNMSRLAVFFMDGLISLRSLPFYLSP